MVASELTDSPKDSSFIRCHERKVPIHCFRKGRARGTSARYRAYQLPQQSPASLRPGFIHCHWSSPTPTVGSWIVPAQWFTHLLSARPSFPGNGVLARTWLQSRCFSASAEHGALNTIESFALTPLVVFARLALVSLSVGLTLNIKRNEPLLPLNP